MKPYYDHAGIRIYNADCRDVMSAFPDCLRGIEIEERYCEIAAKRLSQDMLPFPKTGDAP